MKHRILLFVLMLWTPLAVAQAPSNDEVVPDESMDQQITDPELWPQPESPPSYIPPPQPWSSGPSEGLLDPKDRRVIIAQPPPPELAHYKLPPGLIARWRCFYPYEEEVENGAAIYGIPPQKVQHGDVMVTPKVCREKEVPIIYQPAEIDTSRLPPGYTATAVRCEPDEEEIEDGAKLFGIPPLKIPFGGQIVDWYPRVCRKKG
jgi:hypothetical protein